MGEYHHNKQRIPLTIAATLTVMACASCGTQSTDPNANLEEPYAIAIAVENTFEAEQDQLDRLVASFESDYPGIRVRPTFSYYTANELESVARADERDFNVILASEAVIGDLESRGVFGVGPAANKMYDVPALSDLEICAVSQPGTHVKVPNLQYTSSSNDPDRERIVDYSEFEGTIAILDAANPCGAITNQLLYKLGLYSNKSGADGDYADGFAEKVIVAADEQQALSLVDDGTCDIALVWNHGPLNDRYDVVGKLDYGNNISLDCKAGAISDPPNNDAQALWFVEHIGSDSAN